MTKKRNTELDDGLDQGVVELLGVATAGAEIEAERKLRLRAKIFASLDGPVPDTRPNITVRAGEGNWIEVEPLLEKKVLNIDENGIESYLLRLHPGAAPSGHMHHSDELCIVLEGDVSIGDLQLNVGDCHIAHKGSMHDRSSTVNGALLFLQAAAHPAQSQTI